MRSALRSPKRQRIELLAGLAVLAILVFMPEFVVKHMKPLDLTIEEMRDLLTTRDRLASCDTNTLGGESLSDRR